MEDTTTSTQVDDAAVDTTTADPTKEQAVDTGETEDTTSSESTDESQDSNEDVKTWADKKGLDYNPDNPNEAKLAKMVYEGDKKVTEATQQASDLKKAQETAGESIGNNDIQQLENKIAVMDFYQANPDARQYDAEMAKVLEEKPYFANDLEGLLYYTKGREADRAALAARQEGSKEALQATAQAERAAPPKASATVKTSPKKLTNEDIRNMSIEEYQAAKDEGLINPYQ